MRAKHLLAAAAILAVAIPVVAQDRPTDPGPTTEPATPVATTPAVTPSQAPAAPPRSRAADTSPVEEQSFTSLAPPVELPDHAKRDPNVSGWLDPTAVGLDSSPWQNANGVFLSTLMRRLETPLASRWAHIGLRNALLAKASAPPGVNPVDWAAERAWLLLRMGEADAARMLISGVDVDEFTPKMFQVAVQSALANADPSALCPLQDGIEQLEKQVYPLIDAMCAALAGEPEAAASRIESVRRRSPLSGIDISLAEKVVGATANTRRAVTIEWEPVEQLNSWRFGLATATAMTLPERLLDRAPLRIRAWQAQAPLIAPADRLDSAKVATGLGIFSSQALTDLQALIYDSTGPDELPETDAWQLSLAFTASDPEARVAAMRRLWQGADGPLETIAVQAMLGRAASRIQPSDEFEADVPDLIASMLAAGFDREAARWRRVVERMDDDAAADAAWAMLALGAPDGAGVKISSGRIEDFIKRDSSARRKRSAFLVAGLAGLGRIDPRTAGRLNSRHGLGLDRSSSWTRAIDKAGSARQPAAALLLTGTGLQNARFEAIPSSHIFHAVTALKRSGQEFTARMLAAEALAST